jgi:uncharacterized membrane protein YeiH
LTEIPSVTPPKANNVTDQVCDIYEGAHIIVAPYIVGVQFMPGSSQLPGTILFSGGRSTGVFGGIFRDILANRMPEILKGDIYALAALIGATVYVLLLQTAVNPVYTLWIPVAIIIVVRLYAIKRKWSFPEFKIEDKN